MKPTKKNVFIEITHFVSEPLLDNPFLFNYVRFLLAGRQKGIKKFIRENLIAFKCRTVSDFCCGTGDFADPCPKNIQYVGFDSNIDFIRYSQKRYKNDANKKFMKVNVLKFAKTENKKYDAILLVSAIHHFSDNELKILLPQIKKMVKKVVIIADIIPNPPHLLQKFFAKIDRGRYVRPADEKIKILNRYFKIVKTQPIPTGTAVQFGIVCVPKK